MVQIRKATDADIDALIKSRCRTMREVCSIGENYEFSAEFMESTREYFLRGDGTTVIATDNSVKPPEMQHSATQT